MFTKIDYGNGVHFIAVAFSKDGLHFDEYIKVPNFNPRADTHNHIIYDEALNRYVLITRTWRDSLRLPCVSTSADFINWTPIQEILNVCDYENQIYSMPIFKRGDYILGLASVFHEGDQLNKNYDTVDLQLTYSYRHVGWHYLNIDTPLIPRGKGQYGDGEFDCGCIYSSAPVTIGDRTYFYYMGGNGQHTNFRETSLSRAYIEKDHFAYWDIKRPEYPGVLYTNGFIFLNDQVYLDADIAAGGFVTIELFENNHTPMEITASLEKIEDGRYQVLFSEPLPRTQIRLKISFKNAKIYAIEGNLDIFRIESDNALLRGKIMKYDLYDNCIELLKEREVTIEDMAALVIFSQQKYYPELTLDDASYAIQRVLKKREVQNVIMTGIELDKLAEAQKLSPEFQKIMEKDNPLYGIDEVIVLSILNLYGSIAFTNYGYLDKLKPLILERLNENHEGVCNVFLDDIVGAIAAAACSKIAHNHASDEI